VILAKRESNVGALTWSIVIVTTSWHSLGGESSAIARVASGDSEAIEAALCFVEARPFFFRSGYMFKAFLQKLKRAKLNPSQSKRFGRVLSAYALWREQKKVKQAITSHNKPLDAGRAERPRRPLRRVSR
jgi:hypothetical protein